MSSPHPPHDYLRRLNAGSYEGLACVHWSMTIEGRQQGWLNPNFYSHWREIHLHTLARYQIACPAFCLMPDHLHLLWMGLSADSNQRNAAKFFREHMNDLLHRAENSRFQLREGMSKPGDNGLAHRLQLQGYDHVLTAEERQRDAFARVAFYIFENPVRKGLVKVWSDYQFTGAQIAGYPKLDAREPDYWERFWKIYERAVEGKHRGG
jgi:REP element-mobilizing transposase RayT